MFIIYAYQSPNNKLYIGQTVQSLNERCKKNGIGYKDCIYFYKSIQKYGLDNFERWIIKIVDTQEEADQEEMFWISEMRTQIGKENVYNLRDGGSHGKLSEETKRKISLAGIGRVFSQESKDKKSKSLSGRKQSKEQIAKITGENHGMAKLTQEIVNDIRKQIFQKTISQRQLAFKLGVSPATICLIVKREIWK